MKKIILKKLEIFICKKRKKKWDKMYVRNIIDIMLIYWIYKVVII